MAELPAPGGSRPSRSHPGPGEALQAGGGRPLRVVQKVSVAISSLCHRALGLKPHGGLGRHRRAGRRPPALTSVSAVHRPLLVRCLCSAWAWVGERPPRDRVRLAGCRHQAPQSGAWQVTLKPASAETRLHRLRRESRELSLQTVASPRFSRGVPTLTGGRFLWIRNRVTVN